MGKSLSIRGRAPENVLREIRGMIERFQEGYTNRDFSSINTYIDELFAKDTDVLMIGTGDLEWCLGIDEVKKMIQSHWKYLGEIFIDIDEAFISSEGNTAWLYAGSMLLSRKDGTEEKYLNKLLNEIREITDEDGDARDKILKILNNTSNSMLQLEGGVDFLWPFRFCAVLVKREEKWLFHQIQFSFPTVMPPDVRLNDISRYERKKLVKGNTSARIQNDIRKVLDKFQEGYTKRDVGILNEFMNELFVKDEDLLVIGTGNDELCLSLEEVRGLVESDWLYWGNAKIFTENAMISSNGEAAWVAADAVLTKTMTGEEFMSGLINTITEDMKGDLPNKAKLLHTLEGITHVLYHVNQGDNYIRPFRFTAVLVKREGAWKFKLIQFSHPTTTIPDVRIIDGKPYFGFMET